MSKPTLPAVAAIFAGPFVLGLLAGVAFELAGRGVASRDDVVARARPAIAATLPDAVPTAIEIELATLRRLR